MKGKEGTMIKEEKGQLTIFFSLLLLSILLLGLTAIEGVRIAEAKTKVQRSLISAQESILADYNTELSKRYHILFFDRTYNKRGEEEVEKRIEDYMDYQLNPSQFLTKKALGLYDCSVELARYENDTTIMENHCKSLRHEIREYMKYREPKELLKALGDTVSKAAGNEGAREDAAAQVDESKAELENQENNQEESEDQGEATPTEQVEDPRDSIRSIISGGILNFVMKDVSKISTDKFDKSKLPSHNITEVEEQDSDAKFDEIEDLQGMLKDSATTSMADKVQTEGLGVEYALLHFSHATSKEKLEPTKLKYEVEYLIAGKNSDMANIKSVVNKITLLRFGMNFAYILTDSAKRAEALGLATAIAGATANPAIVKVVQYLILSAWSYAESLVEVRELLKGGRVPVVKNMENWNLSLSGLSNLSSNSSVKKYKVGLSYQDYLRVFLLATTNQDKKYYRMLDLMDMNVKQTNEKFAIENSVFSYDTACVVRVKRLFRLLPVVGGFNKDYYEFEFMRTCSY